MNRRQFFGAVAGGAVVSKLPASAAPPTGDGGLTRQAMLEYANAFDASLVRFDLLYGAGSIKSEFAMRVVGGEDDPDDLEGWEVEEDEPEVYVSPRVESVDRLCDLNRAILGKENK